MGLSYRRVVSEQQHSRTQHRRTLLTRGKKRHHRKSLATESLEPRHLLASDVIISEVMYHSVSGDPGEDWIELFNRGDEAAELQGYQLTAGVDFTFPETTLEPGGYLAVAADVARVTAANFIASCS